MIFASIFSIPCAFVVVGINFLITINDIFNYIVLCLLAGLMASLVGDWKSYRLIKYYLENMNLNLEIRDKTNKKVRDRFKIRFKKYVSNVIIVS